MNEELLSLVRAFRYEVLKATVSLMYLLQGMDPHFPYGS